MSDSELDVAALLLLFRLKEYERLQYKQVLGKITVLQQLESKSRATIEMQTFL